MRERAVSGGIGRCFSAVGASILLFTLGAFPHTVRSECSPAQVGGPDISLHVDAAARQRQAEALQSMSPESLEFSPWGPVKLVRGRTGIVLPSDITKRKPGQPASDVLRLLADVLMATGTETLVVRENRALYGSERSVVLDQSIRDRPVFHSGVSLGFDDSARRVTTIAAHFVPDRNLPAKPLLSARAAEEALLKALAIAETSNAVIADGEEGTRLGYFAGYDGAEPPQLVWEITANVRGEREEFFVDSLTGIVAYRRPLSTSIVGRSEPPKEVTGVRCHCDGKQSFLTERPYRSLSNCGRLVSMNWSTMPDADRYVALAALPELGWVFSDLIMDGSSPQCVCEVPRTVKIRMQACNSCGCGPWSKAQVIEVQIACPLANDQRPD